MERYIRENIRQVLKRINKLWVEGHTEELASYFHDHMIIVKADFAGQIKGKQACIESYRDFASQASIHNYQESDMVIELWEETAIARYRFEIDYTLHGVQYQETGHEIFCFQHEDGQWLAIWRTQVPAHTSRA